RLSRSRSTDLRCQANDRSRSGNLGHATFAQLFVLGFCRTRAYARDHWSLRIACLHHAKTRARDRGSPCPRSTALTNPHLDSLPRNAAFRDWFRLRPRQRNRRFAFSATPPLRSQRSRSKDLPRGRSRPSQRDLSRLLDSGAPRQPGRSDCCPARGLIAEHETVSFAIFKDGVVAPGLLLRR